MIGRWFSSHDLVLSFLKNHKVQAFWRGCLMIFSGSRLSVSLTLSIVSTRSPSWSWFSPTSFSTSLLEPACGGADSITAADMVTCNPLTAWPTVTHWAGSVSCEGSDGSDSLLVSLSFRTRHKATSSHHNWQYGGLYVQWCNDSKFYLLCFVMALV